MHLIIDLILIGVILFCVVSSAKKGFVRTFVEVAGLVVAVVVAFTVSRPLANVTYDKIIEPSVVKAIGEEAVLSADETADKIWESTPAFLRGNASKEDIEAAISDFTKDGAEGSAASISQNVVKPIVASVLSTLYTVVLIIPLLIIVKLLARVLNRIFSISLVGRLNKLLGAAIGLLKGFAFALIICKIIMLIISFTDSGIWIFNIENIEKTYIFNFLTNVF